MLILEPQNQYRGSQWHEALGSQQDVPALAKKL
jgi:hypothetical protein